ncbi:MAG: DUF1829 domain-containing protein [Gemmataceae bacterium]|nr:DUF1829 domain-containing protein [Gemmataceae bacterium]MCI0740410.1 DUF1829 domain-containing protein [Gemmataceae bacterium]
MSADCQKLVDAYVNWLKSRIKVVDLNGVCEITTPFLDRHNDRLQIFVEKLPQGLRLTDDSYIVSDLEASGCALDTPLRKQMLQATLNGFGVGLSADNELFVEASEESFPQKKHALVQAMLAVNDMFMTAKQRITSLFWDDVMHFLEGNDIRFTPNIHFPGKSGFSHKFDFVIPRSRTQPERVLRAINSPSRDSATSLIFAWTDSKEMRQGEARAYAVLNDSEEPIRQEVLAALSHYDISAIPWSRKNEFAEELAT